MSELKTCPFCGSDAHFIELGKNDESLFDVICRNRECIMRAGSQVSFFTAESANSAWNTRASESIIRAQVIEEVRANIREITDHIGVEYLSILKLSEMLDRMKSEGGKA